MYSGRLIVIASTVVACLILLFAIPYPWGKQEIENSKIEGMKLYKKGLITFDRLGFQGNKARVRSNRQGIFELAFESKITNKSDQTINFISGYLAIEHIRKGIRFRFHEEIKPKESKICWTWIDVQPKGEFLIKQINQSPLSIHLIDEVRVKHQLDPLRGI